MTTSLRVHEILGDLTRRELMIGAGAALVLGACTPRRRGDSSGAEPGTGFPVTIEHDNGSTTIASEAARVVTVAYGDYDAVLALGVRPVALSSGPYSSSQPYHVWPWAQPQLGDAKPEVLESEPINYEKVAALRPDLVLGQTGLEQEQYDKLSQIAPTIGAPKGHRRFSVPWQEITRITGRALGRLERAEELITGLEDRFALARMEYPGLVGKSLAYVGSFQPGSYYVDTGTRPRALASGLGLEIPDELVRLGGDTFYSDVSLEQLHLIDRDLVIWELGDQPGAREAIESEPLYRQLKAHRDGRDVFSQEAVLTAALVFGSVLSLPLVIDRLVPALAAAVDGDPTTDVNP